MTRVPAQARAPETRTTSSARKDLAIRTTRNDNEMNGTQSSVPKVSKFPKDQSRRRKIFCREGTERRRTIRRIAKAIVIAACAALTARQVILMVEEYLSFPTTTLYVLRDISTVQAPAITICPTILPTTLQSMKDKMCKNAALSLKDVVLDWFTLFKNSSIVNGEMTYELEDYSGHWSEQIFLDIASVFCYKCFTLIPNKSLLTEGKGCIEPDFVFIFNQSLYKQIDVFLHDRREKHTAYVPTQSEKFFLQDDAVTSLVIRPEVVERQNTRTNPCILDEGYSSGRCMENCFWRMVQSLPDVHCMIPSLLMAEANLTIPECQDPEQEQELFLILFEVYSEWNLKHASSCNCPSRCNVVDYHVFGDPTPDCQGIRIERHTPLFLRYPSKRVPHFLEKEKVTLLDLLSNIGGIVGICLGASLLTLFDVIEQFLLRAYPTLF